MTTRGKSKSEKQELEKREATPKREEKKKPEPKEPATMSISAFVDGMIAQKKIKKWFREAAIKFGKNQSKKDKDTKDNWEKVFKRY